MLSRGVLRGAPAIILLLTVLGGCYLSLGSGAPEDEAEVVALSLSDGGTLRMGDLVEIVVTPPAEDPAAAASTPSAPYTVKILLQDGEGVEVTQSTVPWTEDAPMPPLTLDDLGLSTQQYSLTVSLLRGDEIVAEKTVAFTFVGEEYALREILSEAPIVHPGSTVSLTLDLEAPADADPVLVWSAAGKPFAEGRVSEGLETVEWTSPLSAGIYTITVSLYPLGSSTSAESLDTDVYVAPVESPTGELGPESSYETLFHLLGTLDNTGAGAAEAIALGNTPLTLLTRGSVVGYRLDATSGFTASGALPPVAGGLPPFSLVVGFSPEDENAAGQIARLATPDGVFDLRLGVGPGLEPLAELVYGGATYRLAGGADELRAGVRTEIVLTLRSAGTEETSGAPALDAILILDGRVVASAVWSVSPDLAVEAELTAGGPGGVTGLLDELGIYTRDAHGRPATDPEAYTRALVLAHGRDARGDGFDGMYLPDGYETSGAARVGSGLLELGAGARLTTPSWTIDPAGSSLRLTLSLGLVSSGTVRLVWDAAGDADPLLTIEGGAQSAADDRIEVTLTPEGESLRVAWKTARSAAVTETLVTGARDAVRLTLENRADATEPLAIDDIAIWPTR